MRLVVGITGASGAIYGVRLLEALRAIPEMETHLIISQRAKGIIEHETGWEVARVVALAGHLYDNEDLGAPVSSGSFATDGMVVAPCSIKTLSGIANSYAETLIVRAADVTLKEGRRLVLVVRETPLHEGHLRLMLRARRTGATILPPVPAFYHRPQTLDDIINHTVGRILDQWRLPHQLYRPWSGAD